MKKRSLGAPIKAIDLYALRHVPAERCDGLLANVGVLTGFHFKDYGLGAFSSATAVCVETDEAACLDPGATNKTMRFVRKDATFLRGFIVSAHKEAGSDGEAGNRADTLVVHDFDGEIASGDSGAPVYMKGTDGIERLAGIISGKDRQFFAATPADFILRYAERLAAADGGTGGIVPDARLKLASRTTLDAQEGKTISAPLVLWRRGIRKVRIEIAGNCSERNAFNVRFGARPEGNGPFAKDEGLCLELGWDNRGGAGWCTPGRKSVVVDFHLDAEGNTCGCTSSDDAAFWLDYRVGSGGLALNPGIDTVELEDGGQPFSNGRLTVELFEEETEE